MARPLPHASGSRGGAAAVVILTVLFFFALIGLTIYSLTRLQPPATIGDSDATRALMLAHAGIDRALQELPAAAGRAWQGRDDVPGESRPGEPWTFWGEDVNANGTLDPGDDANANSVLDAIGQPLEEAQRPSFAEMLGPSPRAVTVNGHARGVSGFLSGSRNPQGDHYVLRVTDAASRIFLNSPPGRLRQMLPHLTRRLGLPESVAGRIAAHTEAAFALAEKDARDSGKEFRPEDVVAFRSEEDLIPLVGEEVYRRLEPYVTAHAWVDTNTLAPCQPENRVRRIRPGEPVFALGDLRPTALVREPRAPVNLNTAPEFVLAVVFEGVQGAWLEESAAALGPAGWGAGYEWMDRAVSFTAPDGALGMLRASRRVSAAQADRLASAVLRARARSPFRTWDDFRRFLDRMVLEQVIEAPQAEALRANADPNALLNDFNPDANAWAAIDKTDLLEGTTEFCFSSMGYFVVESLGRVLNVDGKVAAKRLLKAHVKAYEVWRETVESEFLSALAAGAEPEVQIGLYDGDGVTRRGLALEVLPEAAPDAPGDRASVSHFWYDGRIGLATLISPGGPSTWLRATLTPPMREALAADDFRVRPPARPEDVEKYRRAARLPRPEGEPLPSPLIEKPATHETGADAPPAASPGRLFPDGAFLERDACLRFRALDNLPWKDGQTRSGSVSFWLKPAFDPRRASRPRTLWSIDRRAEATAPGLVEAPVFGSFLFPAGADGVASEGPYSYGFPLRGLVGFGIGQRETADGGGAGGWTVAGIATGRADFSAIRPHEWVHVAFAWDLDQPVDRAFRMAVNGRLVPVPNAFEQQPGSLPLRSAIDLSANGPGDTTWISFGALGDDPRRNFALDGTVDEIRVGTLDAFEIARRDAVEGRYARVGDTGPRHTAAFTSALHSPGGPALPGSIAWTVREAPGLPDSAIRLQFWDGRRWRGPFDEPGGEALGEETEAPASGEFRWRAVFTAGHRPDLPVNETPWLDDVTITYATKPQTLGYSSPPPK
ncbi:MAG: LamG domain-containing protein [Planctomycetes bacterium]|nr:LamG domain-containing protein [Planctomycetota bacterium]